MTSIHSAIELINPDMDFSDPKIYSTLPFPSPLVVSEELFDFLPATDNVRTFRYMGRSPFEHLMKDLEDPRFLSGYHYLFLTGPSGTGKSFILAALVRSLIRKGKRVLYIPDCGVLLGDAEKALRKALQFTFHDDRVMCRTINGAQGTDDLIRIVGRQIDHSLYVVADQCNALDTNGVEDPRYQAKVNARTYIGKLGSSQMFIFSTSGKPRPDRRNDGDGRSVKSIFLHSGLTSVTHI